MMVSFVMQTLLSFMVLFINYCHSTYTNCTLFSIFFLCQLVQSYSLFLFYKAQFNVRGLRSIWTRVSCGTISMDLFGFSYIQFEMSHLLKLFFFPACVSSFFTKKKISCPQVCGI